MIVCVVLALWPPAKPKAKWYPAAHSGLANSNGNAYGWDLEQSPCRQSENIELCPHVVISLINYIESLLWPAGGVQSKIWHNVWILSVLLWFLESCAPVKFDLENELQHSFMGMKQGTIS